MRQILIIMSLWGTLLGAQPDIHQEIPTITVQWAHEKKTYELAGNHLKKNIFFSSYHPLYFKKHILPLSPISYRNHPTTSVPGKELHTVCNKIATTLQQNKHLDPCLGTILKDSEFHYGQRAGLIVIKLTNYPFVLKLFSETPFSFTHPEKKGFYPRCMNIISGGMNRYLAGFGRIQNLEAVQKKLKKLKNPPLDIPRKWFWLPEHVRWLELRGKNFDTTTLVTHIPGMYGIIADYIDSEEEGFTTIRKKKSKTIFNFCKSCNFSVDPGRRNYRIEKDTHKLVLIDTEHYPSLLGFEKPLQANSYLSLHVQIAAKTMKDGIAYLLG